MAIAATKSHHVHYFGGDREYRLTDLEADHIYDDSDSTGPDSDSDSGTDNFLR